MAYEEIPHVEFDGARIYMPENKINVIKSRESWTIARIQREFRIGFNAAEHLVRYMQSIGVLSDSVDSRGISTYHVKTQQ